MRPITTMMDAKMSDKDDFFRSGTRKLKITPMSPNATKMSANKPFEAPDINSSQSTKKVEKCRRFDSNRHTIRYQGHTKIRVALFLFELARASGTCATRDGPRIFALPR